MKFLWALVWCLSHVTMLDLTRTWSSTEDDKRCYHTLSRWGNDMTDTTRTCSHLPCATTWWWHALAQISCLVTMIMCPCPCSQWPTECNDDNECIQCDDTPLPSLLSSPLATSSQATSHNDNDTLSPFFLTLGYLVWRHALALAFSLVLTLGQLMRSTMRM